MNCEYVVIITTCSSGCYLKVEIQTTTYIHAFIRVKLYLLSNTGPVERNYHNTDRTFPPPPPPYTCRLSMSSDRTFLKTTDKSCLLNIGRRIQAKIGACFSSLL
ncbi:hypothetical protein Tsp_10244 [Trichinella spiralis]|uniref:hypothetical protein n=1 Tax=Trichinella spiralis TaxID=6334 RepID=UPI0001EFDFB1|nr:hypothetical protein Tsp_10244 [Trichinella spiralis]